MKKLFPLLSLVLLAGCAPSVTEFAPGDVAPSQFAEDKAACEAYVGKHDKNQVGGDAAHGASRNINAWKQSYNTCMKSKGYKEKTQ